MRLCANMFLRGLFTSDIDYQPGISASEARKLGLLDQGISPMPREMAFHLPKGTDWHQLYDYIKFPPDQKVAQFGIIANAKSTLRRAKADPVDGSVMEERYRYQEKTAKLHHVNHHDDLRPHGKPHQETFGNINSRGEAKVNAVDYPRGASSYERQTPLILIPIPYIYHSTLYSGSYTMCHGNFLFWTE